MRVEGVARRGRSTAESFAEADVPLAVQPQADSGFTPLDGTSFRDAIKAHVSGDRVPFFTIVRARVPDHAARALSEVAIRTMRVDGGDLAAVDGAELSVYLHSARRKDVSPFVERLRDEWRRIGKGEIEVDTLSYPADEQRVQELFGPAA